VIYRVLARGVVCITIEPQVGESNRYGVHVIWYLRKFHMADVLAFRLKLLCSLPSKLLLLGGFAFAIDALLPFFLVTLPGFAHMPVSRP
jgi:hypothetical protein